MPVTIESVDLAPASPGAALRLAVRRYGTPGARPKAYIQASLHADEVPAMMAAHHLARLLDEADAEGRVAGEVVLVPAANPIGLAQRLPGVHLGRYDGAGGGNFNRGWPDLAPGLAERLGGRLGPDASANVALIRATMAELLAELPVSEPMDSLRVALLSRAADADIVLDLHCDSEALVHLYIGTALWPDAEDLSRDIGSEATLLAAESGGGPFDEACSAPFWQLQARFPDAAIPPACLACTVEYRGQSDVHDRFGAADAAGLLRFLQRRGVVDGEPGPLPPALCEATRLDATEVVRAPAPGVLAYHVAPGDVVERDDLLAELFDPMAEHPAQARQSIRAGTRGKVLSILRDKLVRPGDTVAKVVGREPLADRVGNLLED